jgi:predicted transposase/invertase (TIGR01784 family)
MQLLDPKLDVVFKMLFAEPRNAHLLKSLLTAVLNPREPIVRATVLDPELPKDLATDRGVRLDVLVELAGGKLVDVEMECDLRRAHGARWLYHWARLYSSRLRRGDPFEPVEPVVCIVFLDARSASRFHSTYEVREIHNRSRLSEVLAIHVVELPRLEQATAEGERIELERWARFLRFNDDRELESLASEEPIMAEAKHALEVLSREPSAQRIAEIRREAEIARKWDRAEDRAEGREEGLIDGRDQGLRTAIEATCRSLSITLDEEQRASLAALHETELLALLDALLRDRAWPQR